MITSIGVNVTPNEGKLDIGERLSDIDLQLWLVTAVDGGLTKATVAADLTEPSTSGTGYGRRTLTGGTATTTGTDPTTTTYDNEVYTLADTVDPITHIAIVNPTSGRIQHIAPLVPSFSPDGELELTVTPSWTQS